MIYEDQERVIFMKQQNTIFQICKTSLRTKQFRRLNYMFNIMRSCMDDGLASIRNEIYRKKIYIHFYFIFIMFSMSDEIPSTTLLLSGMFHFFLPNQKVSYPLKSTVPERATPGRLMEDQSCAFPPRLHPFLLPPHKVKIFLQFFDIEKKSNHFFCRNLIRGKLRNVCWKHIPAVKETKKFFSFSGLQKKLKMLLPLAENLIRGKPRTVC